MSLTLQAGWAPHLSHPFPGDPRSSKNISKVLAVETLLGKDNFGPRKRERGKT